MLTIYPMKEILIVIDNGLYVHIDPKKIVLRGRSALQ